MRPLVAAVLTIVGGVFIALGGLVLAVFGTVLAVLLGIHSGWFFLGLAIGLVTILLGALMLVLPPARTPLGIVTIVLAVLSVPFAFGGFVVGFLLAVAGGTLAIAGKASGHVGGAPPSGAAPPWT